ncbi:hypothetical protein MTO96_002892 [Rhipicephalus appendiculatus]
MLFKQVAHQKRPEDLSFFCQLDQTLKPANRGGLSHVELRSRRIHSFWLPFSALRGGPVVNDRATFAATVCKVVESAAFGCSRTSRPLRVSYADSFPDQRRRLVQSVIASGIYRYRRGGRQKRRPVS